MYELKTLEEEKRYMMTLTEDIGKDLKWNWKYNPATGHDAKFNKLSKDMNAFELYITARRKRIFIPEKLSNPFYLDYEEVGDCGVFRFAKRKAKGFDWNDVMTGEVRRTYRELLSVIGQVNKDKTNKSKYDVSVSPIRVSLRGDIMKNCFAMRVIDSDGSICCFYFIKGRYHIFTNTDYSDI